MHYLFLTFMLAFPVLTQAQQEFIVGKSANTLRKKAATISGEYSVSAFGNIRARRAGLDLAFGITDRFTLSVRGNASDFGGANFELETGSATLLYQLIQAPPVGKRWSLAAFGQATAVARSAQIPGDINLDTNSSGFALGLVANRQWESTTLAGSLTYAKVSFPRLIPGLLDGFGLLYQLSANKQVDMHVDGMSFELSLIAELIGQFNNEIRKFDSDFFEPGSYLDWVGALQVTVDNQYRVELGLQTEIFGNVPRFSESLYHIRLKYLINW